MTNPVRFRKLLGLIAAFSILAFIVACDMEANSGNVEPVTSEPAADEPAAAGGGGACGRLPACCRAYIDAMGGTIPASTCDAYANTGAMPEATCQSAINGYVSGLNAMSKTVPSECQ